MTSGYGRLRAVTGGYGRLRAVTAVTAVTHRSIGQGRSLQLDPTPHVRVGSSAQAAPRSGRLTPGRQTGATATITGSVGRVE